MRKYQKFIRKDKMPDLQLEDKKMPMIQIIKQTNSLRFIHPGEDNQVSAARTADPLSSNSAAVYFQAFIRSLSSRCEGAVGIIQKDCALKRHPGMSNMSIGYLSTGDIYINGKKAKKTLPYKSNSTVGVGIIYSKQQVFFTLDGNILETLNFSYNSNTWPRFYPCLSLRHQGDQIQLRCKNFSFKFADFLNKIVQECVDQIQKQPIDVYSIYSLVGDYLKFHGYKQTYDKMKQNLVFNELTSFVEHPFWEEKIHFEENDKVDENLPTNNSKAIQKKNMEDEIEEDLIIRRKCSTRQRIMSDYWGEIHPNQLPRKRVYESERQLLESRRKSSIISNMQIEQSDRKNRQENQEKEQCQRPELETTKQKFLKTTRIEALNLIRQQKIEQALQILKKHIPQIFEVLDYLEAYFHMHVYIRTLKNDGSTKAMLYMRTQAEKFKKFKQQLYPVYCSVGNKLKFVPFSQMMGLVSLKPGTNSDILTTQQFYSFSNYVNELILKNMGLYPQSRLDTFINHIKCIQNKSEQYQINGLSIECDI